MERAREPVVVLHSPLEDEPDAVAHEGASSVSRVLFFPAALLTFFVSSAGDEDEEDDVEVVEASAKALDDDLCSADAG